jgi:putative endopeptidase
MSRSLLLGTALLAAPVLAAPAAPAPAQAHGIDLAGMDKSVTPGDDFYGFANGNWMKATEIPADRASYGVFTQLAEEANRRTQQLIQDAAQRAAKTEQAEAKAGSDERKIGDYYWSYMDEAGIETKGLLPLKPVLEAISQIADRHQLAKVLGDQLRTDVDPLNMTNFYTDHLFGLWVAQDFNDPERYTPYLLQGGLGLPDRDYYLADNPKMAEIRQKYQAHVAAMLRLAQYPDADARAARIVALEHKIAQAHWPRVDSEDVLKANNPWSSKDFAAKAPGLDWDAFFAAAELSKQDHFIVWQASAITGLSALTASEPLDAWKDWLTFHALEHFAGVLPKAFVDERFDFFGKTLTGTPKQRDRWKRAVDATNGALGMAVGRLYVKRYFPPEAKAKAKAMVKEIVAAFGKRIDALDWMAPATKAKAKEKLKTLVVGIGYPDKWRDYSGLQVVRGEALANAQRAERFDYERNVKKLGQKVDRAEWSLDPQTVNAVNMPLQNALNFPAAILDRPFFDAKAPMAVNFGGIGSTIGHEISHSFDDQGSQFDASGKLTNWWTPQDLAHFKAASQRLAAQFSSYQALPDMKVNGQLTLSENIADVAGVSAAYDGYRMANHGKIGPTAQGLTGDQQFFLSFGQVWRTKMREPLLRRLLLTDGHAPGMFRASTVRNLDAWYPAFGVKEGQKLFLAPADRVKVW